MNGAGPYDTLFQQLERDHTWGLLSFRLKDGKPVQIKMELSFDTIQDALTRTGSKTPE